ncbi:MAG: TfoX/Sxy family protein [Tepidiformaceae bacterium]
MSAPRATADERFEAVVGALISEPGVTAPQPGRSFGSNGLRAGGKIFAMLSGGRLVLKLPKARVDALVASNDGERFDPRKNGRVMKEWLALDPRSDADWTALAREALAFVAPKG